MNNTNIKKSNKITMYTGKSMLVIERNIDDEYVMFTIIPAVGQQKYDYNNRIVTKMSGNELSCLIEGLQTYRLMGPNGFSGLCALLSNNKTNNAIQFYHDSNKQQVSISLFLTNTGMLNLFFNKTDKTTNNQSKIGFTILPSNRMFLELVLIKMVEMIVEKVHLYELNKNNQGNFNNPQQNFNSQGNFNNNQGNFGNQGNFNNPQQNFNNQGNFNNNPQVNFNTGFNNFN